MPTNVQMLFYVKKVASDFPNSDKFVPYVTLFISINKCIKQIITLVDTPL